MIGGRARIGLVAAGIVVATVLLAMLSPLREISGDNAPGRLGAVVLRCAGSFDLARIDYIKKELDQKRTYYFLRLDEKDELTSLFGPAPAVVGALAMLDVGEGTSVSDHSLRQRERFIAAMLVGIAAVLLMLAALAYVSLARAALAGAVSVLSFAGAATLGQGLWQATPALPCLVGALATLAWGNARNPRSKSAPPDARTDATRATLAEGTAGDNGSKSAPPDARTDATTRARPRWLLATPALLAMAIMIRPTIGPLALGLAGTWIAARPSRRAWIIAAAVALVAIAPLAVWNAVHLYSPFPLGQWQANKQMSSSVFAIGNLPAGLAGLVASPGRGLVWFAPIAIVGAVAGARAWRFIAAGIGLQLLAMALFFKWHGGQAYGPRLLAESTWIAIWLAFVCVRRVPLLAGTAIVTCIVGVLGLWRWRPEQFETRRFPEAHPSALWDIADSPITSLFNAPAPKAIAHDVLPTNGLTCEHGHLRSW